MLPVLTSLGVTLVLALITQTMFFSLTSLLLGKPENVCFSLLISFVAGRSVALSMFAFSMLTTVYTNVYKLSYPEAVQISGRKLVHYVFPLSCLDLALHLVYYLVFTDYLTASTSFWIWLCELCETICVLSAAHVAVMSTMRVLEEKCYVGV